MCRFPFYYDSVELNNVSDCERRDTWTRCKAELTPSESSDNATLLIHFALAGELWIDNVSLMPADNIKGWRKDVVRFKEICEHAIDDITICEELARVSKR